MKKTLSLLVITLLLTFCSPPDDDLDEETIMTTFNFTHNWDGTAVTRSDFNTIQYTNANGEAMSIEKLRYLISKITFKKSTGETIVMEGYNLVDVTNNANLIYIPSERIPIGAYDVSITFGFNNDDNYQNYLDLNSASWNVPAMLGGGYHFMQLEGKFIDNTATETGYAYHTIRAVDNSGAQQVFQDTFFTVDLGEVTLTKDANLEVKMNIAEWFKNPNQWDLNVLGSMLMPNFNAQVMMHANGQKVFSLGEVTQ